MYCVQRYHSRKEREREGARAQQEDKGEKNILLVHDKANVNSLFQLFTVQQILDEIDSNNIDVQGIANSNRQT